MPTNTPTRATGAPGSTVPTGPAESRSTGPEAAEGAPAHTGFALFSARVRGRHRKPRSQKLLPAAGGLALTAGALSLVRLASGPGPTDIGAGTGPRPVAPAPSAATSPGADGTGGTGDSAAPVSPAAPGAGPSSPTALGGRSATLRVPFAPGGTVAPTAVTPPLTAAKTPSPPPDAPGAPQPPAPTGAPSDDPAPPPAPADRTPPQPKPPPPDRQAPPPPPHRPGEPDDNAPVLCVPIIGLCVGGGPGLKD
ncbi:hypothetical protein ACWZEH_22015 [Streptomyces sp. QTS137]